MEEIMGENMDGYKIRLWKRLAEIDERFFEPYEGHFLFNGKVEALSKEHVMMLLNKLVLENYNDYKTEIFKPEGSDSDNIIINEFDIHNLLFYLDENSLELWTLCPVYMALLFEEYEIAERLIDNGYPIDAATYDYSCGDYYIKEYDYGGPFEPYEGMEEDTNPSISDTVEKGLKSLTDFHMIGVDDFLLIKKDIPDSLADKLIIQRALTDFFSNPTRISDKYRKKGKFGKPEINHLLKLFSLPHGFNLVHDLIAFSRLINLDFLIETYSYHSQISKDKEVYEELKHHLNDGIKCQTELLKRLIDMNITRGYEHVTANNPIKPTWQWNFWEKADYEIVLEILYMLWEKRKSLLKISEAVPSMYEYCYIEAAKELTYLERVLFDDAKGMTKKQQKKLADILIGGEKYLEAHPVKFTKNKSFFNAMERHFTETELNRYGHSTNRKLHDIECYLSSFDYLVCMQIWGDKEKVTARTLRYINMLLRNIKTLDFTKCEYEGEIYEFDDIEIIKEDSRIKKGLVGGLIGILYCFDYEFPKKTNKSIEKEISKCLNYTIDMENQELIIFLFESGILPRESIVNAKAMAIAQDKLRLIPAIIGLEATI